jgi:hypothetical protein
MVVQPFGPGVSVFREYTPTSLVDSDELYTIYSVPNTRLPCPTLPYKNTDIDRCFKTSTNFADRVQVSVRGQVDFKCPLVRRNLPFLGLFHRKHWNYHRRPMLRMVDEA